MGASRCSCCLRRHEGFASWRGRNVGDRARASSAHVHRSTLVRAPQARRVPEYCRGRSPADDRLGRPGCDRPGARRGGRTPGRDPVGPCHPHAVHRMDGTPAQRAAPRRGADTDEDGGRPSLHRRRRLGREPVAAVGWPALVGMGRLGMGGIWPSAPSTPDVWHGQRRRTVAPSTAAVRTLRARMCARVARGLMTINRSSVGPRLSAGASPLIERGGHHPLIYA